jgi:hypothetical protein
MGGFVNSAVTLGKEAVEESGALRALKNGFEQTPAGKFAYQMIKEVYEPTMSKAQQSLTTAAKAGGSVTPASEILTMSKNAARKATFGTNDAAGASIIKWAEQTHGNEASQSLADHIHVYLQDSIEKAARDRKGNIIPPGTPGAGTHNVSLFKERVKWNKEAPNALDTSSIYVNDKVANTGLEKAGSYLEQKVRGPLTTVMVPALAISHLSTPFNTILGTPLTALAKGLSEVITPAGYERTKQALLQTGVLGAETFNAYRDMQEYSSGKIAQMSKNPTLGYYLNKAIHAPGFSSLRKWTIAFTGAVGKQSAQMFADRLVANPADKLAQMSLKEMGIEPATILAQRGQLSPAQMEKAIYRFVDDRAILNTKLDRSYAQSNPWFRLATMYHGYVSAQGHLIARELTKAVKSGDIMNAVQTFATLGVIFPAVGHTIYGLERWARFESFNDPDEEKEGYIHRYIDDISHMAAFGIAQSYGRATLRQHLSDVMVGPVGNIAVRGVQDAAQLAFADKHPYKPLVRDALSYSLPDNLGKIMANALLPTKKAKKGLKKLSISAGRLQQP